MLPMRLDLRRPPLLQSSPLLLLLLSRRLLPLLLLPNRGRLSERCRSPLPTKNETLLLLLPPSLLPSLLLPPLPVVAVTEVSLPPGLSANTGMLEKCSDGIRICRKNHHN